MHGLCDICGNASPLTTCGLCGKRICSKCFNSEKGACSKCLAGFKY